MGCKGMKLGTYHLCIYIWRIENDREEIRNIGGVMPLFINGRW